MQHRNGQNWHSSVKKYVHHNRKTAKIGFCTSLKSISISGFVDTRDKVNADVFPPKDVLFGGRVHTAPHFGVKMPQKPLFWGVNRHFQA